MFAKVFYMGNPMVALTSLNPGFLQMLPLEAQSPAAAMLLPV